MGTGNSQIHINQHLKLLLYLDNVSLTYSTFNMSKKCFESIEQVPINSHPKQLIKDISQILQKSNTNKQPSHALVAINRAHSTFIPEPLFDKKNLSNYIKINKSSTPIHQHIYVKQKFTNCYTVSSINQQIEKLFTNRFKTITIKPFASIFVDYAIHRSNQNKPEVFIHLNNNHFNIVYLKNKKFVFYNKFIFDNTNDFLYYVTNCLHVLNINQYEIKINIISNLNKTHAYFKVLKDYVKNVVFLKRPDIFLYNPQLLDFQDYKNHNIFSQIICE